jgi:proteasome lid subunit RPN8/RPN11
MSVHRTRALPVGPAHGRLLVAEGVIGRTSELLQQAGALRPPHEGLVWWLGRQVGHDFLVLACHRPPCRSGPQFVMADESATGNASRAARVCGLTIVAQIHSHPGSDTRHSDGDDDLVLMPYDGMFSLVVGEYGLGSVLPGHGAGLHQYQSGLWVSIQQAQPALVPVASELLV